MITVEDIAWVRYAAPDLELMEAFLSDFGLQRVRRTADRLYMRAHGREPFVHVTEPAAHGAMCAFYRDALGMRLSDSYYAGSPDNVIASFLHCELQQQFVDHHTVAIVGIGRTGFEHSAFEVTDLDDLMSGNAYLLSRKRWKHSWGIGRHIEGSQLFDYWRDPFGNKIEHWTDGDLINDDYRGGSVEFNPATGLSQWGPPLSPDFME